MPDLPGVADRIEAAELRGRPVPLSWWRATGRSAKAGGGQSTSAFTRSACSRGHRADRRWLLARRDLRLGHGDRRGTFRAWALSFGLSIVTWIVAPGHVNGLEGTDRMFATLGTTLFWSSVTFVVYLALEPCVRRTWPVILITWSRLVSGRLRDPLVGRDLLVGTITGLFVSLIGPAFILATTLAGKPQPRLVESLLVPLYGWRSTFATILNQPFNALLNGMMVVLMLLLIRQGVKWLASRCRAFRAGSSAASGRSWPRPSCSS